MKGEGTVAVRQGLFLLGPGLPRFPRVGFTIDDDGYALKQRSMTTWPDRG
jgi:hypothetical protein